MVHCSCVAPETFVSGLDTIAADPTIKAVEGQFRSNTERKKEKAEQQRLEQERQDRMHEEQLQKQEEDRARIAKEMQMKDGVWIDHSSCLG